MARFVGCAVGAVFLLLMAWSAFAAAPTARMETRAAPTESEYPRTHSPQAVWLSNVPLSKTIQLAAPSEFEFEKRTAASSEERRSVAFGRTTDAVASTVILAHRESAIRFLITSPSAIHLRVAITFSDSAQYRITAYRPGDESRAVSLLRKPSNSLDPLQTVWTPITDGEAQVIVVERISEASNDWSVSVPIVSHFDKALYRTQDLDLGNFGASAPCQVNIACVYQVAPTAMQSGLVDANFAVALMAFTKSNGLSYYCTGTLLNTASFPSPIFMTAFHCLSDAPSLASLTTIWFFNRVACQSGSPNPATAQVAGGATSIFGSQALDAALVLLNQMPPPLATYTGWDASTMPPDTFILAMHHPRGDVKKASFGTELGINASPIQFDIDLFPAGTFYVVSWQLGIVEPGSSGSGLLSFDPTTSHFYLRGTLTGGDATCSASGATTYYARLDNLYPYIQTALTQPLQPQPGNNYQGLWWRSPGGSESGWGINFAHQGDTIFASWFTYDLSGKGLWLVMTAPKIAANTYSGALYTTTGPAFNAVPFNPQQVVGTQVGSGTLTFGDANNGSLSYTVNGITQTKAITRQIFGPLPSCATATGSLAAATNYQDLWWATPAGSESGWGVNFTHQGDTIFVTWFTYDVDHTPMWLVVTAPKSATGVYSGTLYRTIGPAFNAVPFNPTAVMGTAVGTATLSFSDGNNASFAYTVNGISQTKAITREVFQNPGTVCQ